jgi:hypothetical protein
MTRTLPFIAAAAILSLASVAARADEVVYPRAYTAEDCRDLDRQIDDSIRFANLDGASAAALQTRRIGADEACFGGQFAVGARQLRDVLDDIIAVGARYHPAAPQPAVQSVAAPPPGSWREGCTDVVVADGVLHADCVDHSGRYIPSQLDLGSCRQAVSNQDGRLACGEPQTGRPLTAGTSAPSGSAAGAPTLTTPPASSPAVAMPTVAAPPPAPPPDNAPVGAGAATMMPPPEASAAGPPPAPGALPAGNWIATCRNARMIGTILQSECQDRIGNWRLTAIDTRSCSQPIANRNGGLSCY